MRLLTGDKQEPTPLCKATLANQKASIFESLMFDCSRDTRTWYQPTVPLAQGFEPAIALNLGSDVHSLPMIYRVISVCDRGESEDVGFDTVCPTERSTKEPADICSSEGDMTFAKGIM